MTRLWNRGWVFGAALIMMLAGCRATPQTPVPAAPPVAVSAAQTAKQNSAYQDQLRQALASYWQAPDTANLADIKTNVLAITVPKDYLQLHLRVVISLSQIESGRAQAKADIIAQGRSALEELAGQNHWLR